jgi:RNA polymerase sigma-70 factor (ECF subfamily)
MRFGGQRREKALLNAGYRFAFALTHSESDAEDLVQTAFLRLQVRYGAVESVPLLYTTIRHLFYDGVRRENVLAFEPLVPFDETIADPDARVERIDARVDVGALLATLRPEEREALYLSAVVGFTTREIAELTGQPRNTVLSLVHRARGKLVRRAANLPTRGIES